jgi:hypothetical protein
MSNPCFEIVAMIAAIVARDCRNLTRSLRRDRCRQAYLCMPAAISISLRQTKFTCQQPTKAGDNFGVSQLATKSLSQGLTEPAMATPTPVSNDPITGEVA